MYFGTVHAYVKSTESCSKFAKLLEDAGSEILPKFGGSKTLFLPNNSAFEKLTDLDLQALELFPNKFVGSLLYKGDLCTAGMFHIKDFNTIDSTWSVTLSSEDELIIGDGARFLESDILCSDGVVHVMDTVLLDTVT
ncbi:uncharacterized protein LOC134814438 [Bolinopsis microptera]|uniref:uncharacterized protein LOC134814438 n=1 Tax=Bolinopsis microptera TaxID=2820187 RepID=UPI00307AC040